MRLNKYLTNRQISEISVKRHRDTDQMLAKEYNVSLETIRKVILVISKAEFDARMRRPETKERYMEERAKKVAEEIMDPNKVVYRKKKPEAITVEYKNTKKAKPVAAKKKQDNSFKFEKFEGSFATAFANAKQIRRG